MASIMRTVTTVPAGIVTPDDADEELPTGAESLPSAEADALLPLRRLECFCGWIQNGCHLLPFRGAVGEPERSEAGVSQGQLFRARFLAALGMTGPEAIPRSRRARVAHTCRRLACVRLFRNSHDASLHVVRRHHKTMSAPPQEK